ncbi:MAG: UDP-glucose 4-epimerase GalE [Phycisphaerae bacterium]|nr:UDP-glucose 4-epimerase GalE [Phycisphaerae bacterium]
MKVFVTGGAGYVGSHCVKLLCEKGHDVTVFDSLVAGHKQAVHPDAAFVQGDLADRDLIRRTLSQGFDAVMHFAAFLIVPESVSDPLKYYENNVSNTVGLLRVMKDEAVRKLIFSSTCAVYGEVAEVPVRETLPLQPISPYGRTKLMMEWALQDSAAAWGLASTALRYFNASGAAADGSIGEDHDPEIHLIPILLQVALGQRESIKVFGTDYDTPDGTCVRDYIHVDDLAAAHLLALEALPDSGKATAYNVGTGRGNSVREVLDAARRVTGHPIPAQETDRRPGDPPALYADPTAIRAAMGWQPKYTEIETVVETAWRWHQAHPNGYGG